jgi:glycerol uptake facilitator-like aquaporin
VLGFFFVILLIIELYENKQKSGIYFFGIILSLILFIQILFSLQNITKTFSNKNSWLLVLIVNSELMNSNDFIE